MTVKKPTKHQLKSSATRQALLDSAEEIFARDGYERAQVDEIAQHSGRTRGAVYTQYRTKEHLFFAVQERRMDAMVAEFTSRLQTTDTKDYKQKLDLLREYYADLSDARSCLLDTELKLYALRHPESAEEWRRRYLAMSPKKDTFATTFGFKQQKQWSHINTRVAALGAVKSGLLLSMSFMPAEFPADETQRLLREIFNGLFPEDHIAARSIPTKKGAKAQKKSKAPRSTK